MTEEELFAAWHREFEIQNRELKDEGEEPLTPAEFFACRAEDAIVNRIDAEAKRVERWHATYNAALTGIYANSDSAYRDVEPSTMAEWARIAADAEHGPRVRKP